MVCYNLSLLFCCCFFLSRLLFWHWLISWFPVISHICVWFWETRIPRGLHQEVCPPQIRHAATSPWWPWVNRWNLSSSFGVFYCETYTGVCSACRSTKQEWDSHDWTKIEQVTASETGSETQRSLSLITFTTGVSGMLMTSCFQHQNLWL